MESVESKRSYLAFGMYASFLLSFLTIVKFGFAMIAIPPSGPYSPGASIEVRDAENQNIYQASYIRLLSHFIQENTDDTPANMITNYGAESGVSPCYTFAGGPAIQQSASQHHNGNYSFLSANRTQYYHGPAFDIKPLVTGGQLIDGERYTFSVWVKHLETTNKNLHLNIKKVDGSGTKWITLENESVPQDTWVKIEAHYLLDITGTLTSLELYVRTDNGQTFSFYADDFYLGELENYTPPESSTATDFVRVNGTQLMVGASNSAIVMDGINVTVPTDADDDEEDIWDVKSISQEDFQNIASLGFNAIRLHMNYVMFEDDGNPGVYKEDGWHWLDRCIALAKDAGLYLLLDMHAPQGGYQSNKPQGFPAFWDGSGALPNTSNQDRLIDLWGAIANRYKHEPTVLGYDLINEPRPNTSEEWYLFAEQIIAKIRTYDNNHLIVVEVPFIPNYTIREVNDNKVMYDSHFYYTWGYATQYSAAYGNGGDEWGKYDPENPIYINSSGNVVAQGTPGAVAFDDAYLESILLEDILDFTTSNDVPTNVGEFGIVWEAYSQNVGAIQYMRDLYKLLDGENSKNTPVSRFYFSYQGNTFGLYTNWNGFQTNQTEVTGNLKDFFANNYTWTGETGTDWSTTGNWSTDLSPEPANNVIVPVTANQPHITATPASPAICNNLTINTGAELIVDAGKAITVSGTLANAGNLLVKSTATGTGSVLHSTPNIEAQIERYIAGWSDNEHGWHFLSAPVAGQVISAFHDYTTADDFYKWDELGGEWINRKDADGNLNPAFETEFAIGRGYLIAKQANETPVFEGLVNVSNVSVSGLTNTSVNSTSGWHLLGNPFACALLWNQTNGEWNLLNVAANCQVWDESSASYQVTEPDDIIPAANGFMVYTNGNGSLTIPASARTHSAIDWFKNDKSENRIVLTATDLTGNTSQKTIIRFHPEASESYDLNFDSYFLSGFAPLFYSKSQDENYALNSLPSFNENMKIQLGFTKNINQNFSIGVSEKMENIQLFLIDKKLTVEHLLQPGSPYFFNSEPGDDAERFELTMITTGMNEGNTNETLEVYFSNGELHFIGNQKKVFVEIYDLLGRIVAVYEIQSGEYQKVPIALLSGVYIVRAFNSFSNNSLKIIIP